MALSSTKATTPSVWWLVRRFLPYLIPVRWKAGLDLALLALSPLVAVLLLWLMKYLIDEVFVGKNMHVLPSVVGAYIALIAIKLSIDYWLSRVGAAITQEIDLHVRVDLYRHLITVSPGSLRKHSVGELLSHLVGDADRIESLIYGIPVGAIFNVVKVGYFVSFLLLLSWKLTLCALLTAPVLVLLSRRFSVRTRRLARISRRKTSAWFARAEERLGTTTVIQAFDASDFEVQNFEAKSSAARIAELRAISFQARFTLLIEAIGAISGLLVLVFGAYEMYVDDLTVGALIAFLGSVGSLYSPIASLAKTSGRLQRAAVSVQRVSELLDTASLVADQEGAKPLIDPKGRLEFSQVRFAYPGGPEVLHGVSLSIEADETFAVVGPNGSGKSTLVQLALRLYDPTDGTVSFDGVDLRDLTLDSLRRVMAVVFQDSGILEGSIGENIRYGRRDATEENLEKAAEIAHIHTVAAASPRGYGLAAGSRGSRLSGGERQRLALARALLRDAPILLLDEATASVDSETEQLIQGAVERFHGKRTILLVSHRLSTVLRADRVVVLEQGRVVETGLPRTLLNQPSRFRELFAAQIMAKDSGLMIDEQV